MIENRMLLGERVPLVVRRRSAGEMALVGFAVLALAVRAAEVPANPFAALRIILSVAAVAFVCFAPIQTLARRAIYVLAFELLCGCATFAFVDVPFVFEHQAQIGAAAGAISTGVDRFERALPIGR